MLFNMIPHRRRYCQSVSGKIYSLLNNGEKKRDGYEMRSLGLCLTSICCSANRWIIPYRGTVLPQNDEKNRIAEQIMCSVPPARKKWPNAEKFPAKRWKVSYRGTGVQFTQSGVQSHCDPAERCVAIPQKKGRLQSRWFYRLWGRPRHLLIKYVYILCTCKGRTRWQSDRQNACAISWS